MIIRTARDTDLFELAAIEAECFPPGKAASLETIEKRLKFYPRHFLLLIEDGKIVSFINGFVTDQEDLTDEMYSSPRMHRESGRWQMVFGVDTLPAYRRKGYASILMRQFISEARRQGRTGLVLTCLEEKIHFYERFGFEDEGISSSEHGGVSWHQMRLVLKH
ncbi:MAG: GNAT family N-acetyltransferase [Solobacterium sp.]|nr:GNAT family N-acetyltransferase [Solobacterium sp.]